VTERSPVARHAKLCKLGESALALIASMALSDYRNRRRSDPDPKTESVLAGLKRISMGQYLQVFRAATDAIQPALFDCKARRPENCPAAGRFASAVAAIELEARNLRKIVAQRLASPRRCSWLAFWERLTEYRNKAEAHPATYSWPTGHPARVPGQARPGPPGFLRIPRTDTGWFVIIGAEQGGDGAR
jgi:hypothetical protein